MQGAVPAMVREGYRALPVVPLLATQARLAALAAGVQLTMVLVAVAQVVPTGPDQLDQTQPPPPQQAAPLMRAIPLAAVVRVLRATTARNGTLHTVVVVAALEEAPTRALAGSAVSTAAVLAVPATQTLAASTAVTR